MTPTKRNASMIGDPWSSCAICGDAYRVSQLTRQPDILKGGVDVDDWDDIP